MIWKIIWTIVAIWVVIWVINHPGDANAHFHNAWHALFGSAG